MPFRFDIFSPNQRNKTKNRLLGLLPSMGWNRNWPRRMPLVSVVWVATDRPEEFQAVMEALKGQTLANWEMLILDLGAGTSPEPGPGLRILDTEDKPLDAALNQALQAARGKYICRLLGGHVPKPTFLEKLIAPMEYAGFDLSACYLESAPESTDGACVSLLTPHEMAAGKALLNSYIMNLHSARKLGGYSSKAPAGTEDADICLRLLLSGCEARLVEESLIHPLHQEGGALQEIAGWIEHASRLVKRSPVKKKSAALSTIKMTNKRQRNRNLLAHNQMHSTGKAKGIIFALPFMMVGGGDTVMLQLAGHLASSGYPVYFVTNEPYEAWYGDNTPRYERLTPEVYHLYKIFEHKELWFDFLCYLVRSRNVGAVIIVGNTFLYDVLPKLKKHFPELKVMDILFNEFGHMANNRRHAGLIDLNATENVKVARVLLEEHGEDPAKVRTIPNGVDTQDKFNPDLADPMRLGELASLVKDKFVVSFIGRFSEEKAPDRFVEIVGPLCKHQELLFIMAGVGPLMDKVKTYIKDQGLKGRILCPGILPAPDLLAASSLMLMPSRFDGRPNAVLESLSMGVPVVASRVGGMAEIIEHEKTGLLCPADDLAAFRQAVLTLWRDWQLWREFSREAREQAVARLDVAHMKAQYKICLDNLLSE